MPKYTAIINNNAGIFNNMWGDPPASKIEPILKKFFSGIRVFATENEKQSQNIIREVIANKVKISKVSHGGTLCNKVPTLILAGGDGTIHSVLPLVIGKDINIGLIPMGSANNIAVSLGIPSDLEKTLEVIKQGSVKSIDIGCVGNKYFIEAAGIGFHAEAFKFSLPIPKHEKSIFRSLYSFVRTFLEFQPFDVELTIDGKRIKRTASQITFSNLPFYGTGFMIAPDALYDDGMLDIVVIGNLDKTQIVECILSTKFGMLQNNPNVEVFRGSEIKIKTALSVPIHIDTTVSAGKQFIIKTLPQSFKIIVPPSE